MSAKTFEDFDAGIEDVYNPADSNNLSTKLDRRRRIEEIDEAKRLREELCEFA
jgi:hypothetical protein